jgi:hypothetical protein
MVGRDLSHPRRIGADLKVLLGPSLSAFEQGVSQALQVGLQVPWLIEGNHPDQLANDLYSHRPFHMITTHQPKTLTAWLRHHGSCLVFRHEIDPTQPRRPTYPARVNLKSRDLTDQIASATTFKAAQQILSNLRQRLLETWTQ